MPLKGLVVGVPREIMPGEKRVALSPEVVARMIAEGAQIIVETNAGSGSFFQDSDYEQAGAQIVSDVTDLYNLAQVILKVKEPRFNEQANRHEVDLLHEGQWLITFLHPAAPVNHDMVEMLARRKVIALTLDGIPRITRAQSMDALTSMSTVAGYKAVLMAAGDLSRFIPMVGTAVGVMQPAQVLVAGAGVAGLQALATAKRLGAVTHAADIRPDACEQAKSVGAKVIPLDIPENLALGEGGYARRLPEEWLERERTTLAKIVNQVDIIILAALVPGKRAPVLVTETMVRSMKPGSVIVDIAIDQGGNCEITERGKIVQKHGISIHGIQNLPGTVPAAATWLFSNNICNYLTYLYSKGELALDMEDDIVKSSLVTFDGKIVHAGYLENVDENKTE